MQSEKKSIPPHVFHYTTTAGCQAIVESQRLHASNILYLNDRKELRYVDGFIKDYIKDRYISLYVELRDKGIMNKPFDPEMLADGESRIFIDIIHRVSNRLGPIFVCCFCRPADASAANNGLLSQWRGYGADGGIAICFNVAGLTEVVNAEVKKYEYVFGHFGDVIYGKADSEFDDIEKMIPEFARPISDLVEGFLKEMNIDYKFAGERGSLDDLHVPYSKVAPRLKHPGFSEEREYRIILSVNRDSAERQKLRKEIKFKPRDNYLVPSIELGDPGTRLPIEYVIVGPSREATRRRESVDLMLRENGYDVEVKLSEIPFA